MSTSKRSRTFEWEDPRLFLDAMRGMSGLEFLQRFANKEMPRPPALLAHATTTCLVLPPSVGARRQTDSQ